MGKKPPRITDEHILQMMRSAILLVNIPEEPGGWRKITVQKFHAGRKRYKTLTPNEGDPGRIRYSIHKKGYAQRTVYRNKLVWMWVNKKVVPPGYVVDHKDHNSLNDYPDNLELQLEVDSHRQGAWLQGWDEAVAFFDYIAFMGKEPPEDWDDRPMVGRQRNPDEVDDG
jgi:hypothetical protein